jgi:eukaryotic-like serine/threonine-protein kinase
MPAIRRALRSLRRGPVRVGLVTLLLAILSIVVLPIVLQLTVNAPLPRVLRAYTKHIWLIVAILALVILFLLMIQFTQTHISSRAPTIIARNRRAMINRVRNQVHDLLRQSSRDPISIVLGLMPRSDLIDARQSGFVDRFGSTPAPVLIQQAFNAADESLLILGGPGAGKSRMLIQLAEVLIGHAQEEDTYEIPILVNVSDWHGQSLDEWLIKTLSDRYDVNVELGQQWIDNDQLTILLDGLDQVASPNECVKAINNFRTHHSLVPLVVCSRLDTYIKLTTRLRSVSVVEIEAPTRDQIYQYLQTGGIPLSLADEILNDVELPWWTSSPLLLKIMLETYRNLVHTGTEKRLPDAGRSHLYDNYIEVMLERGRESSLPGRRHPAYSNVKTLAWLTWLARSIQDRRQDALRLDRLQYDWLGTEPSLRLLCLNGLLGSLFGLLFSEILNLEISGNIYSAVYGLVAGVAFYVGSHLYPVEIPMTEARSRPRYNRYSELTRRLTCRLLVSLPGGLIGGLAGLLIGGLYDPWKRRGLSVQQAGPHGMDLWLLSKLFGLFGLAGYHVLWTLVSALALVTVGYFIGMLLLNGEPKEIIRPVEQLTWSWETAVDRFLGYGTSFIPMFIILVLLSALIGSHGAAAKFFILFASGALPLLIVLGMSADLKLESQRPNGGIRRSAWHGLGLGVGIGLIAGVPIAVVGNAIVGMTIGLSTTVVIGLYFGGWACLQYLILRLLLVEAGCIPWRYVRFLNFATERVMLRRVGGAYEFVHESLLRHIANIHLPGELFSKPFSRSSAVLYVHDTSKFYEQPVQTGRNGRFGGHRNGATQLGS